jgi:hypothetical protein
MLLPKVTFPSIFRCFTFYDLLHLLELCGINACGDSFIVKVDWKPPTPEIKNLIEQQKKTKRQQLGEQLDLKDPEHTGNFSSGDLYLILKDLYIEEKELVLMLGKNKVSLFVEDNSYLELMSKLSWLYFTILNLDKSLYRQAKNVPIQIDNFFDVIYALVSCGVITIVRSKKHEQNSRKQEEIPDNQHESAVLESSESSLGGAFANALRGKIAGNRKEKSESTDQTPSSNKQESDQKFSQNQSKNSQDESIFKLGQKLPSEKNSQVATSKHSGHTEPQAKTLSQVSLGSKHSGAVVEHRESSKSKLPVYHTVPQQEGRATSANKQLQKLLVGRHQNPAAFIDVDMHAPLFLKKYELVWKKALSEIFHFYQRLQKPTKAVERSFEGIKEKWNSMSSGEWLKFCADFDLKVPAKNFSKSKQTPRAATVTAPMEVGMDTNRQLLASLFNKESKGSLGINYAGFEVAAFTHSENTLPTLHHDRG